MQIICKHMMYDVEMGFFFEIVGNDAFKSRYNESGLVMIQWILPNSILESVSVAPNDLGSRVAHIFCLFCNNGITISSSELLYVDNFFDLCFLYLRTNNMVIETFVDIANKM